MSKRTVYYVVPQGDDWAVKRQGADRASAVESKKADAVERGRDLAKNAGGPAQLKIHKVDGTIQTEHTYRNDPEKYPG